MIKKFRKKPVVIETVQWTGHNTKEIFDFVGIDNIIAYASYFMIKTLEGNHKVRTNDWVIKGIKGEFYPCKPDIFEETYEEVK